MRDALEGIDHGLDRLRFDAHRAGGANGRHEILAIVLAEEAELGQVVDLFLAVDLGDDLLWLGGCNSSP